MQQELFPNEKQILFQMAEIPPPEGIELKDFYEKYKSPPPNDVSRQFDLVLVFPHKMLGEKQYTQSDAARFCIDIMLKQKAELFVYDSVQKDELYVLLRFPDEVLELFADAIDYKFLCDEAELSLMMSGGCSAKNIAGVQISNTIVLEGKTPVDVSPYKPFEHIYLKYEAHNEGSGDSRKRMYKVLPGNKTCFDRRTRLLLTFYLLRAPLRDGGCNLELSKLLLKNDLEAMYPMHDFEERDAILDDASSWLSLPWSINFDKIRDYFGSQIALYYQFLGFLSWQLLFVAFIGFAFQIVIWKFDNFDHPLAAFYAIIVSSWAMLSLRMWSNYEKNIALKAGTLGFEAEEPDRPEYVGTTIKSYIDGKTITYYPPKDTEKIVGLTMSIIASVTLLAVAVVAGIYVLRWFMQQTSSLVPYSSLVASVLNAVQIQVFNVVFQLLAKHLTDSENHRTDTIYTDFFIQKLFLFQFVNSYASFFYLAFVANQLAPVPTHDDKANNYQGQCGAPNCMIPLAINIAIIFGTRIFVTNPAAMITALINLTAKVKKETAGVEKKELTPPERDYMLMEWNSMTQSIENYADTMIQFGFLTLFVTALPIAGFFALINNILKTRVMTYTSMWYYQRPIPLDAEDIGAWQGIFMLIAVISVITNGGMVAFTMGLHWGETNGQLWVFILFQWTVFVLQYLFYSLVPEVPPEVELQVARREFYNEKLIEFVADEDEEPEQGKKNSGSSELEQEQGFFGYCIQQLLCLTHTKITFTDLSQLGSIIDSFPVYPYPKEKTENITVLDKAYLKTPVKYAPATSFHAPSMGVAATSLDGSAHNSLHGSVHGTPTTSAHGSSSSSHGYASGAYNNVSATSTLVPAPSPQPVVYAAMPPPPPVYAAMPPPPPHQN